MSRRWGGIDLLVTCLLMALLPACGHAPLVARGLQPARSTGDELARALAPRRVAVVIGVDGYDDPAFPDLQFAGADAEAFAAVLRSGDGGFEEVVQISLPGEATRGEILRRVRWAADDLGQEDVFVLYFSGHGTLSGTDPARLFLLPSDARPGDLPATALDLDAMRRYLGQLPVQRKALIVDACFDGRGKSAVDPDLRGRAAELAEAVAHPDVSRFAGGEAHLFASSPGRPAFEDVDLAHGVYTHYLIQALSWARQSADLDADDLVTAWEAHDYARGRTAEHTSDEQVPEASIRVVGRNDVVLSGDPAARRVRDQALVFDYGAGRGPYAGARLLVDGRQKGVFPGAVPVAPGQHRVEILDRHGNLLVEGYARLEAGRSVAVRDLEVLSRNDHVLHGLRVGGLFGARESWGSIWGGGLVAVEAFGALRRARRPAPGFYMGGTLGAGISPDRDGVEGLVRRGRGTFWLAVEPGWAGGRGRALLRAGWQLRATMVPLARLPGPAHATLPEEAGWIVFSMGPAAQFGIAMGRHTSLVMAFSLQTSPFAGIAGGTPALHAFGTASAGLEVAL